jgi:ubiquitin-like 1-activating enzyme E1 B
VLFHLLSIHSSQKYNTEYFKQFTLVLNALDNKAARSHVNRLCLAADVPLIESGSAGYLGQVTLIKKGLTECYDCLPKPPTKTFPGCTIRNTPSEPIHCIVWAKHLFNQLFGSEDPDEAVSPDAEDPENMTDNLNELSEKKDDIVRVSTRQWAKQTNYDSKKLFNKLFNDDIKYLLSMAKLWQTRKAPEPLEYDTVLNITQETQLNGASLNSQRVWTVKECLEHFSLSIDTLKTRLEKEEGGILVWDKDDDDALTFVTAAANLRSHIFSILMKSKFDVKSLAGNIIPAIATTNAIIAGLIVLQAIKIIRNLLNECKTVFLRDKPLQQKLIVQSDLVKPSPKCYVCASKPEVKVKLDVNKMTIKQFESKILKQELAIVAPDVEIDDGSGRIVISSEEGETEDNYDKTLSYFGLGNGSALKCDDFVQNYELKIVLIQW